MKRRCVPLRADHNLLTPDTHTLSGVKLSPVVQVRSEVGPPSNLSSSRTASASSRQRRPTVSPPRRLRFEDETEVEAECRYLERQRRPAGPRRTSLLVSKPDLNLYVKGRAGVQRGGGHCDSWGAASGGRVNLHPPAPEIQGQSPHRPHLKLRTEPIRETYIGSIMTAETSRSHDWHVTNEQVRGTNQVELQKKKATATTDLPVNPYAPIQPSPLATPQSKCSSSAPPVTSAITSSTMSQSIRLNDTWTRQNLNQNHGETGRSTAKPHRELQPGAELKERNPSVGEESLRRINSSSSPSRRTSETTAPSQAPPSSDGSDGQVRQLNKGELHSDDTSHFKGRGESCRLSLRRLFSNVRLSRTRTGSLDRLRSRPDPTSDPAPPCPRKSSNLLTKTLSVQSLSVGSPLFQLRKSSSVQNFVTEQKNKNNRSADYKPATDQFLHRSVSLEDVGNPCSVQSVGRVLQVFSDGTFLLELSRPRNQMYGFLISRGGGRPDSGVYVDDMVDSSTEKLYAGLLAVGDEILEVNGEKVAHHSLDQVTQLLTQNTSTSIRVLRHWRTPLQGLH